MAIIKQSAWGHVQRPWGYEVRVDFTDDATGIRNEVLTFPKEPLPKELDAAVAGLRARVESRIALEAAEAAKSPEPTKEELAAKVMVLEKEVANLKAIKAVN